MWLYNFLILLNYLISTYSWVLFEIVLLIVWIIFIKKLLISSKFSIKSGLCFLFISMLFVLIGNDEVAGKIAEISFLLISVGYIQSFIIHMKINEE